MPETATVPVPRSIFAATDRTERKHRFERTIAIGLGCIVAGIIIPLVLILAALIYKASPALGLSFIFENPRDSMRAGGIWAPLIGTFYLVFFSLLVSAPVGILAGIYLNEYAGDNWLTRMVNLAVVNLAGVPSIVHGLFGVGALVVFAGLGKSILAAGITLAIMTMPVIVTSTREALASVPMAFREACWNMGATRWQTIRTIVLPNSISGILTGIILEVSRAAGETAPILFTGAVFYMKIADGGFGYFFPYNPTDQCMALSYHLYTVAKQVRDVDPSIQYGTAVVLIGLVVTLNLTSIVFRSRLRSRKKW
jgi:phosphate transport system permease protein